MKSFCLNIFLMQRWFLYKKHSISLSLMIGIVSQMILEGGVQFHVKIDIDW